VLNFEHL